MKFFKYYEKILNFWKYTKREKQADEKNINPKNKENSDTKKIAKGSFLF